MPRLVKIGASVAALGAFALGVVSCTAVIGINGEFEDIATTYCQCPNFEVVFGGNCAAYVRGQLARDSRSAQVWLKAYSDNKCDDCNNALRCASLAPVCFTLDHACTEPSSCCGYTDAKAGCVDGVCAQCASENQACTTSDECCKGTYCGQHGGTKNLCVKESTSCHHTGGLCKEAADCCGFEDGGLDNIDVTCTAGTCEEHCKLSAPNNCPSCCLSALLDGTDPVGLCGDGSPQCASRCDLGSTETQCSGLLNRCGCHLFAPVANACAYTCQIEK